MKKSQRSHTHANNKSRDGDFYEIPRCFLSFDLLYDTSCKKKTEPAKAQALHKQTGSIYQHMELYVLPAAHISLQKHGGSDQTLEPPVSLTDSHNSRCVSVSADCRTTDKNTQRNREEKKQSYNWDRKGLLNCHAS
jgi:hypothetical protein